MAAAGPPISGRHDTTQGVENTIENVGVFVHLEHNVNGLVPREQFTGQLPQPGSELEVSVARMNEGKRRVSLRLSKVLTSPEASTSHSADGRFAPVGWRGYGEVVKAVPVRDGRGGFTLIRLPNADRPAMMLVKDMPEDLRTDLNDEQVEIGEEILVEVFSVDPAHGKTLLRELSEPDEDKQAA